ncbi:MAG TPA: metal ABC transporter permease [Candidatus Dormibacteraeota bacterium]|nr:metal ABC transporter permease [Candidatus Dormibacteraeota bacterium]
MSTTMLEPSLGTYLSAAGPYFGWDLLRDIEELFRYSFMQHAFEAGTIVALSAGVIGYFVVLRGLSFAAHGLSHIGFAGATGAVLLGVPPIAGLLVLTMSAGAVMGALGQRLRGRDVTIGIVMAWSLGLGLLFTTLYKGSASRAIGILFGEIFGISTQEVVVTALAGILTLLALGVIYRPLLFATLDEEVADAKGVPVRGLSIAFVVILAVAVSEAVQAVGVLLIFALIVAPAAIAERFTHRPSSGLLLSAVLAVLFTWAALTVSYYLPYPVGFFITTFASGSYVLARLLSYLFPRGAAGRTRAWPEAQLRHSP